MIEGRIQCDGIGQSTKLHREEEEQESLAEVRCKRKRPRNERFGESEIGLIGYRNKDVR